MRHFTPKSILPALPPPRPAHRGFTLLELLVVVGIIAALVAILLPSLGRARETGRRVACLANLRQLGQAFLMYTSENEGSFPFNAGYGNPTGDAPEDWIHWQKGSTVPPGGLLESSATAKYLGATGDVLAAAYRCPSDDVSAHTNQNQPFGPYRYSYGMNAWLDPRRAYNRNLYVRLGTVVRPGEKAMVVEENEVTINDGAWYPCQAFGSNWDWLSVRHDNVRHEYDVTTPSATVPHPDRRGNVVFCDGHADFVSRRYIHDVDRIAPER